MLDRTEAREILNRVNPQRRDYHALNSSAVETLLVEADRRKYQQPKNANGSRARYFHAYLMRRANPAVAGKQWQDTEGQDRESYSDNQNRDSY